MCRYLTFYVVDYVCVLYSGTWCRVLWGILRSILRCILRSILRCVLRRM